ncbi:MAG: hypothetical protein QXK89_04995 [Candidatus Bathyarchaeia archaeon]
MNRLELLTLVVIFSLVISLAINVLVLVEVQKVKHFYQELSRAYAKLSELYYDMAFLSPPISKSQAISIALEYGGWNDTTLKDMEVTAALYYVKFYNTTRELCFEVLHKVVGPVLSYSPVCVGNATYRYTWIIIIQRQGPVKSIPPAGYYMIDAVTGEIIPLILL